VLLRLPYLALTSVFALMRRLPMSDADKDIEILTLRHQIAVLQRQISKPRLTRPDRALLAALLHRLPRPRLRQLHLIVSPDTILRWQRDLVRRRHAHASRRKDPGRPRTLRMPNNHSPSTGRMPVLVEGAAESVLSEDVEPRDLCRGDRIGKRMKRGCAAEGGRASRFRDGGRPAQPGGSP
jgi:hypothetical protein